MCLLNETVAGIVHEFTMIVYQGTQRTPNESALALTELTEDLTDEKLSTQDPLFNRPL